MLLMLLAITALAVIGGFLVLAFMPGDPENYKKCQHCLKQVKIESVKCKYCKKQLVELPY